MRFDKRESKKAKSGYTWRVTFDYNDQYRPRTVLELYQSISDV